MVRLVGSRLLAAAPVAVTRLAAVIIEWLASGEQPSSLPATIEWLASGEQLSSLPATIEWLASSDN